MLDHITIRTTQIEEMRQFFQDLLGLTIGYRPAFGSHGYWLYDGPNPIVHLVPASLEAASRETEAYDHIAFRLNDYEGAVEHLKRLGLELSEYKIPELGEHRIFVQTPTGLPIELCFGGYTER